MRLDELRTSAPQAYVFGDGPKREAVNLILSQWPAPARDRVDPILNALGLVDPNAFEMPGNERAVAARIAAKARTVLMSGKIFDFRSAAARAVREYDVESLSWASAVIVRDDLQLHLRAVIDEDQESLCSAWSSRVAKMQYDYTEISQRGQRVTELEARRAGGDDLRRWQALVDLEMDYDGVSNAWEALRHLNGYDRSVEDPQSRFQFAPGQAVVTLAEVRQTDQHILQYATVHDYRLWTPSKHQQTVNMQTN
jgi:hypothetical protein